MIECENQDNKQEIDSMERSGELTFRSDDFDERG